MLTSLYGSTLLYPHHSNSIVDMRFTRLSLIQKKHETQKEKVITHLSTATGFLNSHLYAPLDLLTNFWYISLLYSAFFGSIFFTYHVYVLFRIVQVYMHIYVFMYLLKVNLIYSSDVKKSWSKREPANY